MIAAPNSMRLLFCSGALAAAAFAGVWYLCVRRGDLLTRLVLRLGAFERDAAGRRFSGDFGEAFFAGGAKQIGAALGALDAGLLDAAIANGATGLVSAISRLAAWCDIWVVDGSVRTAARGIWLLGLPARLVQTGQVQTYILIFVAGLLGLLGYIFYFAHHALR